MPAKERSGLNAFVRGLTLPDPNSVPKRPDGHSAHPHLLVQSGVGCLQCEYHTTSRNLLKRHLSQEHGLQLSCKSTLNDRYWSQVTLQSWTQNGKREFWVVGTPSDKSAELVQQSPRKKRKLLEICLAEADRVAQSHRFLREGTAHDPMLSSNWMRRTCWAHMFSSTNLPLLLKMIQSPMMTHGEQVVLGALGDKEIVSEVSIERKLHTISMAIDRFLDRCEDTVNHTDHSLLCWLRSQHHGKVYKAPFELPGREATKKRYRMLWKRIAFFCIRAHLIRVQDRHSDILNLPFSADAWRMIRSLWTAIPASPDHRVTGALMRASHDPDDGDSNYTVKM